MSVLAKHTAAIKSGAVDRSTVIGLRKLLNASERAGRGWSTGRTSATISARDMERLLELIWEKQPLIIGELVTTGKAQLTSPRYRKQLASVAEIVADLQSFVLLGFEPYGRSLEHYTPVYRAFDSHGKSFPFMNLPWQAGGHGPEIMHPSQW